MLGQDASDPSGSPSPGNQLQQMVVTGVAPVTTQERALQDQRLAPNVEDVQSAEQISKYPDVNLADSIKRMPGPAFRMIPEKVVTSRFAGWIRIWWE